MEMRLSVIASLIFLASLSEFCLELARHWQSLGSQVRMDGVYLAGIFLGLMLQLWREKSKTVWMLMMTAAIAFVTVTHLTHLIVSH